MRHGKRTEDGHNQSKIDGVYKPISLFCSITGLLIHGCDELLEHVKP